MATATPKCIFLNYFLKSWRIQLKPENVYGCDILVDAAARKQWLGAIEISSHLGTEKGGVTPSVHHSTSVSHTNRNLWTTRRMLNWLPTVSQETLGVWCIDSLAKRCMPYHNWTHVTVRSRHWTKIIPLYAYDFMDVQDHMPPGAPCDHMILAFYSKLFTF
jgi:hypothetical protein